MRSPSNRKLESRGRGNQGDWVNSRDRHGELPSHRDHNEAVREKNRLKGKRR